jgi:hypothetical protein
VTTILRRALSKKTRFIVLERDNYTCQYCGAYAPDVVLVVDHIIAVALGGSNDLDNLITACETCNQGKSAMDLENLPGSAMDQDIAQAQARYHLMEALARLLQVLHPIPLDEHELERAISWANHVLDIEATEFLPDAGRPVIERFARQCIPDWWEN